ncbi:ADP-ribose glycohydrolase MACROD1 [Dispira simplex]|nr:ADP-ribose glycohydrolase MACROD1 [Dispira simplex]
MSAVVVSSLSVVTEQLKGTLCHPNKLLNLISVWKGDITRLQVDAIVNAANARLAGGGGVDGAIHRGAGPELLRECKQLGGCEPGEAKLTKGYQLYTKHIIHTVGPMDQDAKVLRNCYLNSLDLCQTNGFRTVAFPCIATGVYGYPSRDAALVALSTVKQWLETDQQGQALDRIVFCVFSDKDLELYKETIPKIFN